VSAVVCPAKRRCLAATVGALAIGLSSIPAVDAHDFWVQPGEYWTMPDAVTTMTLQVGHGASRQRSPIAAHRIMRFAAIAPSGTIIDLRGNLRLGGDTLDAELRFDAAGTHLLVLETDEAYSRVSAERFNRYLNEEGLTPALAERERTHRTDAEGAEIYSRCAKSIVQVGTVGAASLSASHTWITRPLGLKLEIVPEVSPYDEPRSAIFPVRVMYDGRPLPGALVKLTNLEHDAAPVDVKRTNEIGRATFSMPDRGTWLVNVIWTRPLQGLPEADFETVFASLSFGFPTPRGDAP